MAPLGALQRALTHRREGLPAVKITTASPLAAVALAWAVAGPPVAKAEGQAPPRVVQKAADLKGMSQAELDALFAAGQVTGMPVGLGRGRVILQAEGRMPKLKARLNSVVWKGKYFRGDGTFTNQWLGFQAVSSAVTLGPSWFDGRPAVVLEYEPDAKVFANARDEIREVAPGLLLGRFYERHPCPRFQGYFVLEIAACGCQRHARAE